MKGTTLARRGRGRWLAALLAALAALLLALCMAGAASTARAATFPDVPEGTWYTSWVEQASEAGLMTGYGQGSRQGQFGPGDPLTRAQVATVLWRMADKPEPAGAAGFPDVEDGSWYAQAVAWCVVTGYVGGPDDGTFVPDGEVTRAELAAMAWRWARWAGVDVACPDPSAFESTTDSQSVEGWAVEAMTWTAAAGVLTGLDNRDGTYTLDPASGATRAQAAKVFVVLSGKPLAPKASHTVTFESNGGTAVAPQSVTCGEAASEPDAPTKDGLAFAGWYAGKDLTKAYGFDTPVTADITLYAGWHLNTYTVTFDSNGGSDVAAQTVSYGSKATEPDAPTKDGLAFAGWFSDPALVTPYDFGAPVASDITLYAKWTEAGAYAVLYSDGLLSLQLGDYAYAQKHGDVTTTWEWDRSSSPWADDDHYDKVTSVVARDRISLSGDCSYMFSSRYSYGNLRGLPNCESMDLKKLDVSDVTSFREMFVDDAALKALDVSGWRAFRSTNFHMTFSGCSSLESLDLSGWDVSGGEGFDRMFLNCSSLASLDLSGWDVSKATDLSGMFLNCSSLTSLDLSGWDVSKATNLPFMFSGCSSLTSLDLSGWNPSSASYFEEMFTGCGSLSTVTLGEGCAKIADQLGGPWYGADGTQYASIPGTALPGTFTKTDPTAQAGQEALALAALGTDVTFDDVALGEESGLTFEDVEESSEAEATAVSGEAAGADQAADVDVPADSQPAADQSAGDVAAPADGVDAPAAPEFADLAGEEAFDLAA